MEIILDRLGDQTGDWRSTEKKIGDTKAERIMDELSTNLGPTIKSIPF